ncbi:MAG: hypothetical protein HZA52_18130 [Planctomycetes bacterium]|nr:hypothetical protein [Planctomycetota bacterium]
MPDTIVVTYLAYLALSIALNAWVARTLHRNGRSFLVDVFAGHEGLAASVNHLLVVGFWLINLGFISSTLATHQSALSTRGAIELLSEKVGAVLVVLGAMHFFNLFVFTAIRSRSRALARRDAQAQVPWLPRTGPSAS